MNILIADDSPGIRLKLRQILEQMGHTIVGEAGTGIEAVALCEQFKPELCLLDIVMPGMDGLTALVELRKKCPGTQVVMVSSAGTVSNMLTARKEGAVDFMLKPFKREKVADLLLRLERGRKQVA
jgi:two-component system chemotaxis response regulator CheY